MMDIRKLLQNGETESVEFKASFSKAVVVSLSAFANTAGGKVVVGVDDTGKPIGLQVGPESEQRYINEIKTATYPQIIPRVTAYELDGRTVLVFEINEYPVKPVSCKNRYYKRIKNSNHLLGLDEIVDLQQQSLNISYDAYPLKEPLESLDRSLMEKFIEKANTTGRVNLGDDLLTNLTKLKLIQDGRPTLAAMLLFGNHGYTLHIGRFKAADTIIDDLIIKAPLTTALDEAMIFIKKHINLSYDFDGGLQRKERWQYPLEGLRELLLNAVVHRDYKNTSDIVIKIFDDRILFTSPGRIYGNLTIADLERDDYVSSIRNKLLAEAFYLMGEIEKYGTGFVRIRQWLKAYPDVGYEISEMGDFFRIEVAHATVRDLKKRDGLPETLPVKLPETLPDLQKSIVLQMRSNPKVTYDQLAKANQKSREAIRKNIGRLKELGIVKRIGPDKGGHWEVSLPE
jgi:ATP-dependent DNA helicase RecG